MRTFLAVKAYPFPHPLATIQKYFESRNVRQVNTPQQVTSIKIFNQSNKLSLQRPQTVRLSTVTSKTWGNVYLLEGGWRVCGEHKNDINTTTLVVIATATTLLAFSVSV